MLIALMYHDVLAGTETSGFAGADADSYKLTGALFRSHLAAIGQTSGTKPLTATGRLLHSGDWAAHTRETRHRVLFTFDDGGISAYSLIADRLEEKGWRGCFFVTTDYIGRPGFLTKAHIRELHVRGHTIGAHSRSHPGRFADCGEQRLLAEWGGSAGALADIVGEAVLAASVPGGHYARRVAIAAEASGIRALFTSEPTVSLTQVGACTVIGRYAVKRQTSAAEAAAIAVGRELPRLRQYALWNAKKVLKLAFGPVYLKARKTFLASK
ncbi:polysaccharide deacetylase family protein [Paenibacillus cymbidii]|uniref:polysaccharide deacetylase family protein n=1 Tax=Paenibacillus cymbidii TaxID=1639034 RepID=UPI0010813020|nr:polysaccharide deacetylase family protein [Paenibacillus cymbidii]